MPTPTYDLSAIRNDPNLSPRDKMRLMGIAARLNAGRPTSPAAAPPAAGLPRGIFRSPLNANEQKASDSMRALMDQIESVRTDMQRMGKDKWNRNLPTRFAEYYGRKYLNTSTSDQQINQMLASLIGLEKQAQMNMMAAAGTRNYNFATDAAGHIPTGKGDYDFNMDNMNYLLGPHGPYRAYLRELGRDVNVPSMQPTPGAAPAAQSTNGGSSGDPVGDYMRAHGIK